MTAESRQSESILFPLSTLGCRLSTLLLLVALAACATREGPAFHRDVARTQLWKRFTALPGERAFALAGDPERVWVGAAVGGHASRDEAERGALAACGERRLEGRLQDPCRLYAVGDEIVWEPR